MSVLWRLSTDSLRISCKLVRINFVKNDFFGSPPPQLFGHMKLFLSLWKKKVFVSCLFWQCSADLFVSHISTTMQADVFWRLILGCFLKQTKLLAFWSLLFMWPRAQRHSCKRLSLSINIKLEDILSNFASFCYYKTCFIYQIKKKTNPSYKTCTIAFERTNGSLMNDWTLLERHHPAWLAIGLIWTLWDRRWWRATVPIRKEGSWDGCKGRELNGKETWHRCLVEKFNSVYVSA